VSKFGRTAQSTSLLESSTTGTRSDIGSVSITVPGTDKQYVHVDGMVTVYGADAYVGNLLKEGAIASGPDEYDYIVAQGSVHIAYTFVAAPGTHTYTWEMSTSPAGESLTGLSLTATMIPYTGAGAPPARPGGDHHPTSLGASRP
jgi:hypothetical protein